MDTKYQSNSTTLALFVLVLILLSMAIMVGFEKKLSYNAETVSYFHDSKEISDMAINYAKNLQKYYIYYKNFNVLKAQEKLDEIDEFITTGEIKQSANSRATAVSPFSAEYEYHTEGPTAETTYSEAPENLYNVEIDNLTVDKLLEYQQLLSTAISNYNMIQDTLMTDDNFHFSLYNTKLDHIIATNSENFYNEASYDTVSLDDSMFEVIYNGETISGSFLKNGLQCQLSIPESCSEGIKSVIMKTKQSADINGVLSTYLLSVALYGSAFVIFVLLAYFSKKSLQFLIHRIYRHYKRLPVALKFPFFVFALEFIISYNKVDPAFITSCIINAELWTLISLFCRAFCSALIILMTLRHLFNIVAAPWKVAREPEIKFIRKTFSDLRFSFGSNRQLTTFFYIITVAVTYILDVSVYVIIFSIDDGVNRLYVYVCIMLALAVFVLLDMALISEIKLRYYISEMADGHIETIPKQRGFFTNSINKLNNVNTRFQQNVEETLKNERLKTDLITNVSHDLKTPLTSIINYIDLLKELKLDNEKAIAYIDVADKKSRRLKLLIEDLFEASKLSSGQMELEMHPTDILALLNQTMGELSDRMEEAGIEFKVSAPKHPVMINMDGQKMWRVFDNMFNNILKYAPNGSRAYVEVEENALGAVVTLKNVANYQMDFDADELFERFKRGDKARTTEGSGLGLSIAKGIVELHGGTMKIVTDGDLFKMIIILYK